MIYCVCLLIFVDVTTKLMINKKMYVMYLEALL